jgi:hypothetical protein
MDTDSTNFKEIEKELIEKYQEEEAKELLSLLKKS